MKTEQADGSVPEPDAKTEQADGSDPGPDAKTSGDTKEDAIDVDKKKPLRRR